MAAARMRVPMAGLLRRSKEVLFSSPSPRVCIGGSGIRRFVTEHGKTPSADETKQFIKDFEHFLLRYDSSVLKDVGSQSEFSSLLQDLSSIMNKISLKNQILYPSELANLVATFVPVQGTYVAHNSKLVVVDLTNRVQTLEKAKIAVASTVGGAISVFAFAMMYLPFTVHQQQKTNEEIKLRISKLEKVVDAIEEKGNNTAVLVPSTNDEKSALVSSTNDEKSALVSSTNDEKSALVSSNNAKDDE